MAGTAPQTVVQVEACDRAAGSLPVALGARDQDDRPRVALDQPRGDDADHALVPVRARDDVRPTPTLRLRPRLDLLDGLAQDPLLHGLALSVQLLQLRGELRGRLPCLTKQQLE